MFAESVSSWYNEIQLEIGGAGSSGPFLREKGKREGQSSAIKAKDETVAGFS